MSLVTNSIPTKSEIKLIKDLQKPYGEDRKKSVSGTWFLCAVCDAAIQLALQLQQDRTQVVCSHKVAQKRLTESKGTPAMDLGHMNVVLKWCVCMLMVD